MKYSSRSRAASSLWIVPVVVAGAALIAAPACLDFTATTSLPPVVRPDSGQPTPTDEAGADAGAEAGPVSSPCADCAEASCGDRLKTCRDTPKCGAFYECAIAIKCYSPEADVVACFTECAGVAKMTGYDDPAVGPALQLRSCMSEQCGPVCQ